MMQSKFCDANPRQKTMVFLKMSEKPETQYLKKTDRAFSPAFYQTFNLVKAVKAYTKYE